MPTLELAIDARRARVGAAQFDRAVGSIRSSAARTTKTVLALVGAIGTVQVIRRAVQNMADYEQSILQVQAVTRASVEDFRALNSIARRLGETTRFSAVEAAEGLLFLARAGFDARESIEALEPTLNLALGGFIEMGVAADIASNVLTQFGLATEETERVVDSLINTANSANTNVLQLAEAMKLAGPIAASVGISLEEAAAAVGVLGNAGIQATLAGTGLRGTLAGLLAPTTKAQEIFRRFGLTVNDINPATNTLATVFERLGPVFEDASNAFEIFGRRQAASATVLRNNVAMLRELTIANERAAGTARENARIVDDSLVGSYKRLVGTIESVILSTGDQGLVGVLRALLDGIRSVIRVLAGLGDRVRTNREFFETMAFWVEAAGRALAVTFSVGVIANALRVARAVGLAATNAKALSQSMRSTLLTLTAIAGFEFGNFLRGVKALQPIIEGAVAAFDVMFTQGRFMDLLIEGLGVFFLKVKQGVLELMSLISRLFAEMFEALSKELKFDEAGLARSLSPFDEFIVGIIDALAVQQRAAIGEDGFLTKEIEKTQDRIDEMFDIEGSALQAFEKIRRGLERVREQAEKLDEALERAVRNAGKSTIRLLRPGPVGLLEGLQVSELFELIPIPDEFRIPAPPREFIDRLHAAIRRGGMTEVTNLIQGIETVGRERARLGGTGFIPGANLPSPVPGLGGDASGVLSFEEERQRIIEARIKAANDAIASFKDNAIEAAESARFLASGQDDLSIRFSAAEATVLSLQDSFDAWKESVGLTTTELIRMDREAEALGIPEDNLNQNIRVFREWRDSMGAATKSVMDLTREQERLLISGEELQRQVDIAKANAENQERINNALAQQTTAMEGLTQAWNRYGAVATSIGNNVANLFNQITSSFENAVLSIIDGTKSTEEAFKDMAREILREINRMILRMILFRIIQGAGSALANLGGSEGAITSSTDIGTSNITAEGTVSSVTAQTGGMFRFRGPHGGFQAPLTLHGTEDVEVTPVNRPRDDDGGVTVLQTVNINAIDAQSFQQRFRAGIAKDIEFLGNSVGNEIARRPPLKRAIREG